MDEMMTGKQALEVDVVCIGQAVIDCITRGREEKPYKENVWRAESIRLSTGGDAVNEAFALASLERSARLVSGVGEDLAGGILLHEAERRGVDISFVTRSKDLVTPIANLIVRQDGSRFSINSQATKLSGYNPSVNAADVVKGARIVSFASLFRAPLDDPSVIRELIRAAHASGAVISADTKLPTYRAVTLDDIADVLPLIDYIFPNEKEAAYYTGQASYADMASCFKSYGIKNVIIKTGPEGCYASLEDGEYRLPPLPGPVVDTTGAGDNFVAGFLSALLEGSDGSECLHAALLQASQSICHIGASPEI